MNTYEKKIELANKNMSATMRVFVGSGGICRVTGAIEDIDAYDSGNIKEELLEIKCLQCEDAIRKAMAKGSINKTHDTLIKLDFKRLR